MVRAKFIKEQSRQRFGAEVIEEATVTNVGVGARPSNLIGDGPNHRRKGSGGHDSERDGKVSMVHSNILEGLRQELILSPLNTLIETGLPFRTELLPLCHQFGAQLLREVIGEI